MGTPNASPVLQNPDLAKSYQAVYDLLTQAYWEASDVNSKDLIYGVQKVLADIIDELDVDDVAALTQKWVALKPKIDTANQGLQKIKDEVNQITKNIGTAATMVSSITKVLSFF